jgi:DNA-binding FadR family transcriptional regulator
VLADELRDDIASGRLRPGQRLPAEPELCVRAGLSRSTVREALRLLTSQRLIVTTRGVTGGSFVAHPDAGRLAEPISTGVAMLRASAVVDVTHLVEVRRALEVPAAALAARRRTERHLQQLRAALFDPLASTTARMLDAHREFHSVVAAATGNALFELLTRPLYQLSEVEGADDRIPAGYWVQVDADHRELLRCLERGDDAGAAAVSERHLDIIDMTFGA